MEFKYGFWMWWEIVESNDFLNINAMANDQTLIKLKIIIYKW